jgi:hypothetical protein
MPSWVTQYSLLCKQMSSYITVTFSELHYTLIK